MLAVGICLSLIVLQKNKKTAWNFPRKCSSKKQNRCIGGAGTKRWLPNHAGIRQREGRSRWAGVCVLITPLARTPQTALLSSCSRIDLLFAELRSRSWREGGSAQRSLALIAKVAVTTQSVLQHILPMHILYFARIIDRRARSESMP